MRDNFAIFVISHGRPDNVPTFTSLRRHGYTGRIFIVIDDEDLTGDDYRARFEDVLVFSKDEIAQEFDTGDQEPDRRASVYARNACWGLARQVGVKWFGIFDDDYTSFAYRVPGERKGSTSLKHYGTHNLDGILEVMLRFLEMTPTDTFTMGQGGDAIGGLAGSMARIRLKRKAMNSFLCDVDNPISFVGRLNEDVSTYVWRGRMGDLFYTYSLIQLVQVNTQKADGGMSETYRESGTYVKSMFTVMYAPSCTRVTALFGTKEPRLHHRVDWNAAVPMIMSEKHRRTA